MKITIAVYLLLFGLPFCTYLYCSAPQESAPVCSAPQESKSEVVMVDQGDYYLWMLDGETGRIPK